MPDKHIREGIPSHPREERMIGSVFACKRCDADNPCLLVDTDYGLGDNRPYPVCPWTKGAADWKKVEI